MRDALRGAVSRAGWRLDALLALAIGCLGAGELLSAPARKAL